MKRLSQITQPVRGSFQNKTQEARDKVVSLPAEAESTWCVQGEAAPLAFQTPPALQDSSLARTCSFTRRLAAQLALLAGIPAQSCLAVTHTTGQCPRCTWLEGTQTLLLPQTAAQKRPRSVPFPSPTSPPRVRFQRGSRAKARCVQSPAQRPEGRDPASEPPATRPLSSSTSPGHGPWGLLLRPSHLTPPYCHLGPEGSDPPLQPTAPGHPSVTLWAGASSVVATITGPSGQCRADRRPRAVELQSVAKQPRATSMTCVRCAGPRQPCPHSSWDSSCSTGSCLVWGRAADGGHTVHASQRQDRLEPGHTSFPPSGDSGPGTGWAAGTAGLGGDAVARPAGGPGQVL